MTSFSKRQFQLLGAASFLSVVMLFAVPALTRALGPLHGYLSVFVLYWLGYCLPVALIVGRGDRQVGLTLGARPLWIPVLALGLPVGVLIGAGTLGALAIPPALLALAIGSALVNGPLEELAWRRPFRANSGGHLSFELIGLFLFTLWHVPLYFAEGIAFDHGALGLIGGALMLGAVWTAMTRAGDAVGWPMLSHMLVNVAAFIPLFAMNFAG